jgi:hypothetical protein
MDISELKRQKKNDPGRHPWEITRAKVIRFLLRRHCLPVSHIADIGSGDAYVLQQLQKKNIAGTYSAIDTAYSDEILNHLKENSGQCDIYFFKTQQDFEASDKKADLFFFLDVLEHCEDDKSVLSSVIQYPSAGSEVKYMITVPAFPSVFSVHDKLLGHYRRYTRKQIMALCQHSNLTIVRSGYFFFSLLFVRVIQKVFEKKELKKSKKSIDNWGGGAVLTKFICAILWADFRVCYVLSGIGINLPGLSCYCICKKSP